MCILEDTISTTATVDVSDTEQTKLTYDDVHYVLTAITFSAITFSLVEICKRKPKNKEGSA